MSSDPPSPAQGAGPLLWPGAARALGWQDISLPTAWSFSRVSGLKALNRSLCPLSTRAEV